MDVSLITYASCPGCGSEKIYPAFTATDHAVSGAVFEIWECTDCGLRVTQHAPDLSSMKVFYQSENYISHTDTGKGWINRLYHFIRQQTLMNKRLLLGSATGMKRGKLLDIGAGTGAFVNHMKLHGWDSVGMEPDETARQLAKKIHQLDLLSVESLYDPGEDIYDAISLWHVLEHVHDLHGYLDQLKKIVRPRHGRIFIAVPNYTSYDARVYQKYWAAYDVPRHLYHFSPLSMKKLLLRHEFQLLSVQQMWFDSFYISLLSEKYKTGRTNFMKGFLVGTLSNAKAFVNKEHCSSLIYIISK
ncbi:MAG TPA: class I SAM-dependent methyltransferase [Puia sp.]|nr:class I SAM-dependent methyltransferase [Puia sp.]